MSYPVHFGTAQKKAWPNFIVEGLPVDAIVGYAKFKTVAGVAAGVKQVETATVAGTITTAGNVEATVTSALFDGDRVILVPVEAEDDATAVAGKIRTALAADEVISEHFVVSGTTTAVVLTAKVYAANDATLNIATDNDNSEGLTPSATSDNTTAGVSGAVDLGEEAANIETVLAFVTASGAGAEKTLLAEETDYTLSGGNLVCLTNQSSNTLFVVYRAAA